MRWIQPWTVGYIVTVGCIVTVRCIVTVGCIVEAAAQARRLEPLLGQRAGPRTIVEGTKRTLQIRMGKICQLMRW